MNKLSIVAFALATLALAGSATEAAAWEKNFSGTRAQVVNACVGPNMVLSNGSTNSTCKNLANGNIVDCNDAGNCTGAGTGPNPTRLAEVFQLRGTVAGGAVVPADEPVALTGSIVETILKWKLKGKKKVAEEPMEGASTPNDGPPQDGPTGAATAAPQWHSNGGVIL